MEPLALVEGNLMSEFFLNSFSTLGHGLIGYIVPFLFVLTIVVFFHELGHFLVARWAGVKVLTFSLGFGPELVGFNDRHGTRWKISAIPLGGYVKFFGDESEASTPASAKSLAGMTEEERAGSFHHKKVGARRPSLPPVRSRISFWRSSSSPAFSPSSASRARRRESTRSKPLAPPSARAFRSATSSPPSTARRSAASPTCSARSACVPATP